MHTFPQPDPIGKYFAGSLGTHVAIIALIAFSGMWKFSRNTWGSEHASSGSVGVNMVSTIPIPRNEAPENPLANDTKSNVPQAPAPVKTQAQVRAPDPDAIPLQDKNKRKVSPKVQSKSEFRPALQYNSNQIYSQAPQALSSKMYATQGAAGIDIGDAAVLGSGFGDYVNLMRNAISSHWNTADVRALPTQRVAITFTIARNGAVSDVRVSRTSNNFLLDTSAQRAVLDSNPLPAFPPQVPRNQATVELWFQLSK
jgi:TonB family protein